jgi:hypothetical protein
LTRRNSHSTRSCNRFAENISKQQATPGAGCKFQKSTAAKLPYVDIFFQQKFIRKLSESLRTRLQVSTQFPALAAHLSNFCNMPCVKVSVAVLDRVFPSDMEAVRKV